MIFKRFSQPPQPDWPHYFLRRAEATQDPLLKRFFAAGTVAPETPIGEAPMVALDLETTGLDARRHAIVSIGMVPFDLSRIALPQRRYWVVRPRGPLERESVAFHHITDSDVATAPRLEDVLDEMLATLAGRLAVVHYRHIERPFLHFAVESSRGEGVNFPMIDTMSIEAIRHRQSMWARLRRWLGRPPVSIRLHNSRLRYGLPAYQGHHALVDALATAELLQAQIAHFYSPQTPVSELWR